MIIGYVDFGFQTLKVNLSSPESRIQINDVFHQISSSSKAIGETTNTIIELKKGKKDNVLGIGLKFLKAIKGAATIFGAIFDLFDIFGTDSVGTMLQKLEETMVKEFDKLKHFIARKFDAIEYRVDFHNYRDNVQYPIDNGMSKLRRLFEHRQPNNMKEFKTWCQNVSPIDLAKRLLDQISGHTSILDSYKRLIDFDEDRYQHFENWILNHVQSLKVLMGNCEGVQPVSKNGEILSEFETVIQSLDTQLLKENRELVWPRAIKKRARAGIDAGGTNEQMATTIHKDLKSKYQDNFLVAIYDVTKTDDHALIGRSSGDTNRLISEFGYKNKNYVVFQVVI
ncbi:unnamed protein product, partial [Mesorhabditis belari]|uniref:Uncharacterized protein n=1 Tax=Mesorhabditis belari TaxID=2138241 RepID=A0AAF3F609_9BILA